MMQLSYWIFQSHTGLAWLCYFLICIPSVVFILWLMPNRLSRTYLLNFVFFILLSGSIFLFGIIIAFVLSLALYYIEPPKKEKKVIQLADFPEYQRAPVENNQNFGEGYGYKTVFDVTQPKVIRQKMLVALNQFDTSTVNRINKTVLSDEVDEIRLYAQSLIEKQERTLTQTIKNFSNLIKKTNNEDEIAFYQKQIAHAWWEEIYRQLINQENIPAIVAKVEYYALESFKFRPNDIDLPLLLARVALKKEDLEGAKKWLTIADNNNAPIYKTALFFAEIAFKEKDYAAIKSLLAQDKIAGLIGSQSIISFWRHHD